MSKCGCDSKFPSFKDLGQECRDIFKKGYHIGLFDIKVKSATCGGGFEIKSNATQVLEDKSAKANVEVKTPIPLLKGLSCNTKWDLENNIETELSLKDALPGATLGLVSTYNADSGATGGELKGTYAHRLFTVDANLNGAAESNLVAGGSVVTGYNSLIAAYKVDYDTSSGELTSNNIGIAYQPGSYGIFMAYDNLSVLNGFYFHKISKDLDLGVQAKILGGEEGTELAIGGRYGPLRAKVDNKSILGLGLELKVMPSVKGFLSTDIDLKEFNGGGHKIGFGLEFGN